ncbi:MAG TPA: HlyD family efflux transporter periplasmic adaptor subunit [Blastocatellia bacterium]|nr:HlyD family efflux transporter periplasmic adaptor subunit [Blastocatellia bacterium]
MEPQKAEEKKNRAGLHVVPPPLFRADVLEAQREQALGSVLLIQPLSTRLLTLVAALIAVSLIVLTFWGTYTRKERVKGFLVPTRGLIKVYPRETGTVLEKQIAEGERVAKGDPLFVIALERPAGEAMEAQSTAITRLRERRMSLEGELRQVGHMVEIETQNLQQRISAMEAELAQLGLEINTQQRRIAAAESSHARFRKLHAEGIASEEQMQEKLKDLLAEQAKLQSQQRTNISLTRDSKSLRTQIAAAQLRASTQRAAIERNLSILAQELAEYETRRSYIVRAPVDGMATALLADRGHAANPSQPLVSILPMDATLEAHLLVPSRSIGFLTEHQPVYLRHEAFPYQRFGSQHGRIAEISKTLLLPGETTLPVQLQEPAYRVTVALDAQAVKAYGEEFPLQAGMLLDADIWLDRRKLYEWLLDPVYSVLGRV